MNVYVVDDEPGIRSTLQLALDRAGHSVQTFGKGLAFLSVADDLPPGCVLLDLCLPDCDGLEVQRRLAERGSPHALILLSGVGDVPDAVSAMRAGAVDFLRKPYRRAELFEALDRARDKLAADEEARHRSARFGLLDQLTKREREVLIASSEGSLSKQVAHDLDLSVRTVEMHRANILKKLAVPSFGAALLLARNGGILKS